MHRFGSAAAKETKGAIVGGFVGKAGGVSGGEIEHGVILIAAWCVDLTRAWGRTVKATGGGCIGGWLVVTELVLLLNARSPLLLDLRGVLVNGRVGVLVNCRVGVLVYWGVNGRVGVLGGGW